MRAKDATAASCSAYYDSCAREYAEFARRHPSSCLVSAFLSELPAGCLVVDIGCGSGRDMGAVAASGRHAVGLDISLGLLEIAFGAGYPVSAADMRQLPIASHSVDAVVAVASLHHLPQPDQHVALGEIARVLRPGGVALMTAKLSNVELVNRHPVTGRERQFFPIDACRLETAAARANLETITTNVDPDSRGRDLGWLQMRFRRGDSLATPNQSR